MREQPNAPAPDIELFWCGLQPDGTKVYGPAREAVPFQIALCLAPVVGLIVEYPNEAVHLAALGGITGLIWYFAQPVKKKTSAGKHGAPTVKKRGHS